ncbi:hypothetical protein CMK17_02330 [Candidatus Poribacteria bacterium]|nr:hypothetical protein [Candidatus Poribacteria bacterium]
MGKKKEKSKVEFSEETLEESYEKFLKKNPRVKQAIKNGEVDLEKRYQQMLGGKSGPSRLRLKRAESRKSTLWLAYRIW